MSSLRILTLPLGSHNGRELSIVSDWEKDQGYVTALQEADSSGNSVKRYESTHSDVKKAIVAAIQIYDDYMARAIE